MNFNQKLSLATDKLKEVSEQFEREKLELSEALKRKADLMAGLLLQENKKNEAELADVNGILDNLKLDIEVLPGVINSLGQRIEGIKAEIAKKEAEKRNIEIQKIAKKVCELSEKFFVDLKALNLLNNELQSSWGGLRSLGGNANNRVTVGSMQGLQALLDLVTGEMAGQGRKGLNFGNLPNFRI